MSVRRSSIHTDTENEDAPLLRLDAASRDDREGILLKTVDEPLINISNTKTNINNNDDDDDRVSETETLLDEVRVEPALTSSHCCTNAPARYIIAAWAFFGFFCYYALRVNLSVAIVAMVASQSSLNQSVQSCSYVNSSAGKSPSDYEFQWSPSKQGIILGAFFYGYITSQIIGGNLAEKFGAKWIFGGGVCIAGILTLLTPFAARTGIGFLIAIRILTGIVCGPGSPSAAALWGKWIPPAERSTVPPASQTGSNFGIIFTTPLISVMIEEKFLGGWPSAFYVFGTMACVWFIGWCFFGFNSPDQHPRISSEEQLFLTKHIHSRARHKHPTPWGKILRCPPVYGITILHVCNNYIYYTLLTSLPIYFSTILNFDLHQSGFIFALPYFLQFLITVVFGYIVDRIRARNMISLTKLRKIQSVIGMIGTCACLIAIGYMGCNHVSAVIFCILAIGFLGFQSCGPLISHLDVASNYAGTLVGISNSLGTIPGFVGPYVVGAITDNNQTVEAWRLIFNISAGIGAFGCLAYCILFKAEEQSWNRHSDERNRIGSSTDSVK